MFIFLVMICIQLSAQSGIVKGKLSSENGPLEKATISSGTISVLTSENGRYSIKLPPGVHLLRFSHAGYNTVTDTVLIVPSKEIVIDHVLKSGGVLNEVSILGSRTRVIQRYTAVPVDEFRSKNLASTGQISLTQMLQFTAPSFNTSRELLYESSALRGLDPQHTILLLNGTRYHNLARINGGNLKGQLGRGSVGNDINSIPFPAINKVSVLRDGATAQYGSDGIAGVINLDLKKTADKGTLDLHLGQFYPGDGEKFFLGYNKGATLARKGFINFSGSMKFQAPTYRGGKYTANIYKDYPAGASEKDSALVKATDDSIAENRGFNRTAIADNAGNLKIFSSGILVNSGYSLSNKVELFLMATTNVRKVERNSLYKFPKDRRAVNLVLYPDGFQPITRQISTDFTLTSGVRFRSEKQLNWDLTTSYGSNAINAGVKNSNNASQSSIGSAAPSSFFTGRDIYSQWINSLNFSKKLSGNKAVFQSSNLAGGAEWRMERLEVEAGEEASWKNYDPGSSLLGGSQGVIGTSPENVIRKTRSVSALYIDLENETVNNLLIDLAGRFEYYSDYGGNLAGKIAMRYELSPFLAIRISAGNGFRAPTIHQRYLNDIQNAVIVTGGPPVSVVSGIFANDNYVVKAFDVPDLKPERSINISGGIMASIAEKIKIAIDLYGIRIRDRIILTGPLHRGIPGVKQILDSIPGLRAERVQFFTNAIDTWTEGLDLMAEANWELGKSELKTSLSANFTSTRVIGAVRGTAKLPADNMLTKNALFNTEEKTKLEHSQPENKIIIQFAYRILNLQSNLRFTRFGKTMIAPYYSSINDVIPQVFSSRVITDLNCSYPFSSWANISIGANNLFNVYPDKLNNPMNTSQGMWIYSPEASPFSFNGGYYFIAIQFKW